MHPIYRALVWPAIKNKRGLLAQNHTACWRQPFHLDFKLAAIFAARRAFDSSVPDRAR